MVLQIVCNEERLTWLFLHIGAKMEIEIAGNKIGSGHPVYIVAEMSANHCFDLNTAIKIVKEAKAVGADAIKLQTYLPETITMNSSKELFRINGTIWEGKSLFELYGEAYTPWEWHEKLQSVASEIGLDLFSSPFDPSAVEFLEKLKIPAYKVASFEIVDLPLIKKIAATGKPVIMSTGMANLTEIDEAVRTVRAAGAMEIVLLKCTSSYPAPAEESHLRTIPHMSEAFDVPVGLSDHTLGIAVPVAGVALGACIIEKHLTLSRAMGGPDAEFSIEPQEFKEMVQSVRTAEKALGRVNYELTDSQVNSRRFRRSLFVVEDVQKGEPFTTNNVRSIRPGQGLHTRYLDQILGTLAAKNIEKGSPLDWNMVDSVICREK